MAPGPGMACLWAIFTTCLTTVHSLTELLDFQPGSIYTFRQPAKAFVEYMPKWSNREKWGIEFSFRTHKANTMLLQNSFILDGAKADLWITLQKGQLNVKHEFNEDVLEIYCGKGLNHDHWHEVKVEVDFKVGNVTCTINGRDTVTATLRSEVLAQARSVLVEDTAPIHTALTSLGGFGSDTLQQTTDTFVGCMGNLTFLQDGRPFAVSSTRKEGVDLECLDLCDTDNPCVHGGRCVNHYTRTLCDCFGTGYEGHRCNRKGSSAVTLQGSEWITYIIYDSDGKAHSPVNKVALEFKTTASEGVLFFGYSQTQYNHLAISLRNATLHVSVVFVDSKNYDELWLPLGSKLNDNRWHRVTVNHHGREVTVVLDSHTEKMTASEGHQHLHMDPAVYFGGIEKAHTGKGLRSQCNFVGCLRSLYFNHNAILEKADEDRTKIHGSNPQLGCQDMNQRILQFTHQGAFVKVEHSASDSLEVVLQFRTLKPDAVLVYSLAHSGGDDGYIQVLLRNGQVQVLVVPSVSRPTIKQSATTGENLNDNQWHTLQLRYEEGTTQIEVDGEQSIASFPWKIKLSKATFLGFGPDSKMKYGFVGCMQEIQVQEMKVRPVEVVHSQLGVGVTVGACVLRDWCKINGSFCLNQGHCINDWADTYCDCSHTQYEGKYCQFAKLLRSCDEYYQQLPANERRSGVWTIDVDGSGPLPQSHVYCEMGVIKDGARYGTTWVGHNLESSSAVRGPMLEDLKKIVKYREMEPSQLASLVAMSSYCEQYIQINCSQAPLRLGELTWLVSASGQRFTALGGSEEGACNCHEHHSCLDDQRCNCDAEGVVSWDGGYLYDRDYVPVTELIFKQSPGADAYANVTMGNLKCSGTHGSELTSVVTFIQAEVYIELEGWRGGEIRFDFQTQQPDAVLLYQPEGQSHALHGAGLPINRWKDAQLYILLRKGNALIVMVEGMDLWYTVTSKAPLNDGRWQRVVLEIFHNQLRVTLNRQHFIHDLPINTVGPGNWAQPLYVGGKPRTNINDLKGFVGCIRALTYNRKTVELGSMANRPGLSLGCSPTCSSNPCMNGAVCEEHWSSYSCRCANPFSQSGPNCEFDINEDAISFLTSSSFIKVSEESSLELIQQEIIMSFRSLRSASLLLYIHDHLNNFMQVEITSDSTLTITYNSFHTIVQRNLTIHSIVDGTWKQLAILPDKDNVIVNFEGTEIKVSEAWKMLTEYDLVPFHDQETVVPFREALGKPAGYTAYLGGVDTHMSTLPGFVGCLRGVKLAGTVLNLHKSSYHLDGVGSECPQGCTSSPCVNHGRCIEGSALDGFYTCDCISTGYAGMYCDKEVGLYFGGMSYILMILRTKSLASPVIPDYTRDSSLGAWDSLQFNFATYNSADQHSRAMVLIQSEHDYTVVYLSSDGRVFAEYFIDGFSILLESDVHYTTGWPHHVTLTRRDGYVSLKVDHSVVEHEMNSSLLLEKPMRIMVGGALDVEGQLSYLVNFTGDISNIFYLCDWLVGASARPLDAYYGYTVDTPDQVTVSGPVHDATQALAGPAISLGPQLFDIEPQDTSPQMYSFPTWKVGNAETVKLTDSDEGTSNQLKPGEIAGIVVSIALVAVIAAVVALLLWRRASNRRVISTLHKHDDEEEGLMGIGYRRTTSGTEAPQAAETRSKSRNGRKKTLAESEDMEDEETPMLSVTEEPIPIAGRTSSMEMNQYPNISKTEPVADDSDEEVNTNTEDQDKQLPQSTETSQITDTRCSDSANNSDSESSISSSSINVDWDSQPNIEGRRQQQQQQEPGKTEMRESRGRRLPPSQAASSPTNPMKAAPISRSGTPGEVWTESQVLDFLESDTTSDDTGAEAWDPSGETLVEEEENETPSNQLEPVRNSNIKGAKMEENSNNNAVTSDIDIDSLVHGGHTSLSVEDIVPEVCQDVSDINNGHYVEPHVIVLQTEDSTSNVPFESRDCENNEVESQESESGSSDSSEDGEERTPRSQLKLNTSITPISPPYGKSPGISPSKGKLKLKAKKNSKSKK